MDHAPPAAAPACPTAADTCQCRPAECPHCGAGQTSEMAERHKRNLAEMGEIGMDLTRMIRQQAWDTGIVTYQGTQMFERVTRAVRRAHALEARIDADSKKTAEQWAAEQVRRDAANRRTSQTGQADHAAATPAADDDQRKRENLLDDLRDREDLFDDLDDLADDEDLNDENGEASVGEVITGVHRVLRKTRKQLKSAGVAAAVADAIASEPDAPESGNSRATPARDAPAFASLGGLLAPSPPPIPPALAWPPRAAAAHGPPR